MEMNYAPICLFTYNRLDETILTINALKKNFLSPLSDLYIFSDGPKNDLTREDVDKVRSYLKTIKGFKSIQVFESNGNKGLATSIIEGVSKVIADFGRVIVVEDDLITSPNFLNYMNQALNELEKNDRVFSISGYCPMISYEGDEDGFYYGRAHSWGWACWKDRWQSVDWSMDDWPSLSKDISKQNDFNRYGSDLFKMMSDFMEGKNNSWYIRFTYHQQKQGKLTLYPTLTKVVNLGFSKNATHCHVYNRTNLLIDKSNTTLFNFPVNTYELTSLVKQMLHYKSYSYRVMNKVLTYLLKLGLVKQRTINYGN